jgi:hypothetical protein
MTSVSGRYLELAGLPKRELDTVFAAGSPPQAASITGFEFRGFNHPRATAMLGIRKFIKVFYLDESGRAFGCNTPVVQNGLDADWVHRPSAMSPKRYAFFQVLPGGDDGLLLDYSRGGNPPWDISTILRDYLVHPDAGNDDLLLGKAFFVVAGTRLTHSYFIIERSRPLPDAAALAARSAGLPAQFVEPVVIDAEEVADLVDDGPADLVGDLIDGVAQRADRPAVDGDAVRQHHGVLAATVGEGNALVQPEQARRPVVVLDHHGDVVQQPPEPLGQPVQRRGDHVLEPLRLNLDH